MPRGRFAQNAQRRRGQAQARPPARGRAGRGRAPMPWDSRAQRESAELGNEAGDVRATLLGRYNRAQSELGFGIGADDPYSAVAENRNRLEVDRRRILNTAGNQLYSGSTLSAQSAARADYDRRQKGIDSAIAEEQSAYNRGQAQTSRDEALGGTAIKEGAINRAVAAEPQPLAAGRRGRGRINRGPVRRTNRRRGRI